MKLIAAFLLVLNAQVPRDRPNVTPPPVAGPTGTASISGTVVAADDQHPLALANVVAIGALTGTLKITSTDRNGHFSFTNLAADRYVVGASKPPYVGAVAGARRPARQGSPVVVTNGQKLDGVTVALPRGAVIAGTIYDERGQPAPSTNVILRQWKFQGDQRVLVAPPGLNSVGTDEAGRYRFYGIPPGEYLVSASRNNVPLARALSDVEVDQAIAGRTVDLSLDASLRPAPFYYPGTPRAADATPVVVASGEERTAVDIRVDLVRFARIDGVVVGPDGSPLAGIPVLIGGPFDPATFRSTRTSPEGRFAFPPMLPGVVTIDALDNLGAPKLMASAQVDTTTGDQSGIQLAMRPPMTLAGKLVFDGAAKPSAGGRFVPLRAFGRASESFGGVGATPTNDAGDFQIQRVVPGRYLFGGPLAFGASTDSLTWALKSVMADDRDVTDLPIDITGDAPPKMIAVTYTDQWQKLSGRLTHQSGGPATDETVIVFPADKAYWYQGSRRIAITRPGSDGLFSFGGQGPTTLPPGEYLLAAVTDLGRDEQFDPSFLAALVPAAAPIRIGPGEKKTQDLVIR